MWTGENVEERGGMVIMVSEPRPVCDVCMRLDGKPETEESAVAKARTEQ